MTGGLHGRVVEVLLDDLDDDLKKYNGEHTYWQIGQRERED